jgi:hypothetical protein
MSSILGISRIHNLKRLVHCAMWLLPNILGITWIHNPKRLVYWVVPCMCSRNPLQTNIKHNQLSQRSYLPDQRTE